MSEKGVGTQIPRVPAHYTLLAGLVLIGSHLYYSLQLI